MKKKVFFTKLKNCVNYIGLWVDDDGKLPYSYNIEDYVTTDKKKINTHKELLKEIERKEDERLNIIDTKTSQMITFSGIIFSALSLFIPVLINKVADQSFNIRVLFIINLILTFIFYILTIYNAAKNYNIGKFIYSGSDPNNVIKYQNMKVNNFISIEIKDLLYSNNQNLKTNNDKANNLIYSYRNFRIAILFTAILGVLICSSLLFVKQKENSIIIKNPIQLQNIDSSENKILNIVKEFNKEKIKFYHHKQDSI